MRTRVKKNFICTKVGVWVGKRNDLIATTKYLNERKLFVPFVYGKHLLIQGETYFWAIFLSDERIKEAEALSRKEGVENGWEILSNSKFEQKKTGIRICYLQSRRKTRKAKIL
jgi:hypothetical protein